MANEKNMSVAETEVKVISEAELKEFIKNHRLPVTREPFDTKSGDKLYAYVVRGELLIKSKAGKEIAREIKVDFAAKDQGGYEVLDIIFDIDDKAELYMHDESMTDEKTGEVSSYTVYEIQNTDGNGILYSYKVKPMRESDKALLLALLRQTATMAKSDKKS